MNVTVCIPTRNRPEDLAECLDSIAASNVPVAEVVVSDDSTDDRTRELVAARYPHVKYVFGPRRGLGPNRNSAISAASGDWILFLDDDARLGPGFLAEMMKARYADADRKLIFTGIALDELPMMMAGAIPTAIIAVSVDFLIGQIQYRLVPRGINPLR